MSTTGLLRVASLLIFALSARVACDSVSNLPEFRPILDHHLEEGLDGDIWAIVPSYTFSCAGHVTQWRAYMEGPRSQYDSYELTFSVWRKMQMNEFCSLVKVGENAHPGRLAPETNANNVSLGTVTLNVAEEEQVLVAPGDFVGFHVRHYALEEDGEVSGGASVMADVNRTDVTVYKSTMPLSSWLGCVDQRSSAAGDVARRITSVALAPVITVEIVPLSTTTSTPSPSTHTTLGPSLSSVSVSPAVSTAPTSTTSLTVHPSTTLNVLTASVISSADKMTMGTTAIIIITISLLALLAVLTFMFLIPLYVVAVRKKKNHNSQDDSDVGNIEMIQNRVYSIHNSYTMPGHYKLEDCGYPGYNAIYDTVRPEPLPQLNPAPFSSPESPEPPSRSESASSHDDGYELLYSVLAPFHSASNEQLRRCESIDCPLYRSLSPAANEHVYDVPVQDHTYNVLTRPGYPPYNVPTLRGSSPDLEREDYLVPTSYLAGGEATYEEVSDLTSTETKL